MGAAVLTPHDQSEVGVRPTVPVSAARYKAVAFAVGVGLVVRRRIAIGNSRLPNRQFGPRAD